MNTVFTLFTFGEVRIVRKGHFLLKMYEFLRKAKESTFNTLTMSRIAKQMNQPLIH